MKKLVLMLTAAVLAGCIEKPPVNHDGTAPITATDNVDLDRYLGKWYEIARFPNSFEEDCAAATADYSKRPDGDIKVVNSCFENIGDTEPSDIAVGRAKVVDTETNAKLKVSFFGPFYGDYWVLDVDPHYTLAIVGEPEGRYLWILARAPQLSPALRQQLERNPALKGYNLEALYWVPRNDGPELLPNGEIRGLASTGAGKRIALMNALK